MEKNLTIPYQHEDDTMTLRHSSSKKTSCAATASATSKYSNHSSNRNQQNSTRFDSISNKNLLNTTVVLPYRFATGRTTNVSGLPAVNLPCPDALKGISTSSPEIVCENDSIMK